MAIVTDGTDILLLSDNGSEIIDEPIFYYFDRLVTVKSVENYLTTHNISIDLREGLIGLWALPYTNSEYICMYKDHLICISMNRVGKFGIPCEKIVTNMHNRRILFRQFETKILCGNTVYVINRHNMGLRCEAVGDFKTVLEFANHEITFMDEYNRILIYGMGTRFLDIKVHKRGNFHYYRLGGVDDELVFRIIKDSKVYEIVVTAEQMSSLKEIVGELIFLTKSNELVYCDGITIKSLVDYEPYNGEVKVPIKSARNV